jgi:acetylornithine/succinyldiaminopimelate/putrescine aminotransferase
VTLANEKYESVLVPGDHGSTFGGNPVCAAAAFEILKALSPKMLKRIRKEGAELLKEVQALVKPYSFVHEVRGMGFMLGIQLNVPGAPFVKACLEQGLLINCTQDTVLRFLPPLALMKSEKQYALKIIKNIFSTTKLP